MLTSLKAISSSRASHRLLYQTTNETCYTRPRNRGPLKIFGGISHMKVFSRGLHLHQQENQIILDLLLSHFSWYRWVEMGFLEIPKLKTNLPNAINMASTTSQNHKLTWFLIYFVAFLLYPSPFVQWSGLLKMPWKLTCIHFNW